MSKERRRPHEPDDASARLGGWVRVSSVGVSPWWWWAGPKAGAPFPRHSVSRGTSGRLGVS
ncbi:hypothetical protein EYF80_066672 [Liparis tanakae]|uniref:Uncharacterized protein n=1 Tax=Liparis tanakae TaxID=230148 RepID=A0A4Z2E3S5_9TELE|nr:hypothetical protein EYF80_066672 [Liparis tanakae]